jgi:hypothetical protein
MCCGGRPSGSDAAITLTGIVPYGDETSARRRRPGRLLGAPNLDEDKSYEC